MVEALGRPGDVLLGISTEGRSGNANLAFEAAAKRGIARLGFLGGNGPAEALCELAFVVLSSVTARVQEAHITAAHILMEMVEDRLLECGHIELTSPVPG